LLEQLRNEPECVPSPKFTGSCGRARGSGPRARAVRCETASSRALVARASCTESGVRKLVNPRVSDPVRDWAKLPAPPPAHRAVSPELPWARRRSVIWDARRRVGRSCVHAGPALGLRDSFERWMIEEV